jgi:hypothetical protein
LLGFLFLDRQSSYQQKLSNIEPESSDE